MKIISFVLFSCIGNQAIDISIHEYALRDPLLFGDYRNMINENEPRFYEDLLDYEAIYFLFQEVRMTTLSHFQHTRYAAHHFVRSFQQHFNNVEYILKENRKITVGN